MKNTLQTHQIAIIGILSVLLFVTYLDIRREFRIDGLQDRIEFLETITAEPIPVTNITGGK